MAVLPPAPKDTPLCPEHPLVPASTCRQCGALYCARCLSADFKRVLCKGCNTSLALREAPERLRNYFRDLWITPLIMGLPIVLLSIVLMMGSGFSREGVMLGLLGVVLSLPLLGLALVIGWRRSLTAAWFTFALEVLLLLIMLPGFSLCVIVAAIIPIMTVAQISKIKNLQELQRAHPDGKA